MVQIIAGGTDPNPGGNTQVIQQVQTANWTQMSGKPFITVATKGIQNGLSSILNDGNDFGPDTELDATTTGKYGSSGNYTLTYGALEGINYQIANQVGECRFLPGIFRMSPDLYTSGSTSIMEIVLTTVSKINIRGSNSASTYNFDFSSNSAPDNITTWDFSAITNVPVANPEPYAIYFSNPAYADYSIENLLIITPTNASGIYAAPSSVNANIRNLTLTNPTSGKSTSDYTIGLRVDAFENNLGYGDRITVNGYYTGIQIIFGTITWGFVQTSKCYYGLSLGANKAPGVVNYIDSYLAQGDVYPIYSDQSGSNGFAFFIGVYNAYYPQTGGYALVNDILDTNSTLKLNIHYFQSYNNTTASWLLPSISGGDNVTIDYVADSAFTVRKYNELLNITTPTIPTTGNSYTNSFSFPVQIAFLTASAASYVLTDTNSNSKTSVPIVAGSILVLPSGWTITLTYTTLTWEFLNGI